MTPENLEAINILRHVYYHIATGNGPKIDGVMQEFIWPRYPWTEKEEREVSKIIKHCLKLLHQ